MELRVKVKELETQLKAQESNMKQANKTLNEKERQLNKTETSLLVKDRLLNEQLKSLCARVHFGDIVDRSPEEIGPEPKSRERVFGQDLGGDC